MRNKKYRCIYWILLCCICGRTNINVATIIANLHKMTLAILWIHGQMDIILPSFFLEISVFEVKRNITERVNHLYKSSFKGSTFNLNFSFACVKFWRKEFYFHLILNKFYFALKWNLSPQSYLRRLVLQFKEWKYFVG